MIITRNKIFREDKKHTLSDIRHVSIHRSFPVRPNKEQVHWGENILEVSSSISNAADSIICKLPPVSQRVKKNGTLYGIANILERSNNFHLQRLAMDIKESLNDIDRTSL